MNQMDFEEHEPRKMVIKKCPFCGDHLPPLTKVCPSCGQIIEDESDGTNVTSIMSELDKICGSYSKLSIKFYDYILLLIPLVYLIWAIVVIIKIIKSNSRYNDFLVLKSQAQSSYGDNPRFRSYLGNKTTEMDRLRSKNKVSHAIIYTLLILDAIFLVFSLMSI